MADISRYLQAILDAVYGEEVRGSIHDAIEAINDVSEVILTTGTDIDSASSSSEGYFTGSLYLNTDTYELWKCIGVDTWQSQGILKGPKGDDGEDGENGNKWYRGTGISGKAPNPTVYSGSGIAYANANDNYLNPQEGAVYHCVTGGDATTATWLYDFTMTGGGGGGSIVLWTQIQGSTGATKIAQINIDGIPQDVYAPTGGGGGSSTFAGLEDTNISNPQEDQIVQYKNVGGELKLQNVNMPQGGHTMIDNSTYISSLTAKSADDTDDDVASGYAIANWSNADIMTIVATMSAGDDSVGTWETEQDWTRAGAPRTGWIWHKDLYHILQDNNVEIEILFDIKESEVVNLYAYRVDDEVVNNGVNGGAIAIKTNGAVKAAHLDVAVNLKRQRTNKVNATIL